VHCNGMGRRLSTHAGYGNAGTRQQRAKHDRATGRTPLRQCGGCKVGRGQVWNAIRSGFA
jgi:hypothetical protein